ncbi:MAG: YqaE/Pmp3 family membrane protein [Thermomicrobiales bacterium]
MNIIRLIISIFIPPLGVLLKRGLGGSFILSIILTLLGYIPGVIYACVVVLGNNK